MRVIIAGSRDIDDYSVAEPIILRGLDCLDIEIPTITAIISGGARGPDRLGVRWACQHNVKFETFLANWNKYQRTAGILRNVEMGKVADAAIFIWDGTSRGTAHMMEYMESMGKPIYVEIP